MRLNPPTKNVFWISVIIAVAALIFYFVPAVSAYAFWVLVIGYVLLALGNTLKGF